MTIRLSVTVRKLGSLVDPDVTPTLTDPGSTFGIKKFLDNFTVVPAGTQFTRISLGQFIYDFTTAIPGTAYVYSRKIVRDGAVSYRSKSVFASSVEPPALLTEIDVELKLAELIEVKIASPLGLPTLYPNAPVSSMTERAQTEKEIRAKFSVQFSPTELSEFGNETPLIRISGVAFLQLFSTAGIGTAKLKQSASATVRKFRNVTFSGIRFLTSYVDTVGESGSEYQVNVLIPFMYDVRENF